jgi:guanylate kinase
MQRLVIIGGASGAGKSYLVEQAELLVPSLLVIKKLTTRPARPDEPSPVDLIVDRSSENVDACDFVYEYDKHSYGVRRRDIDEALECGRSPLLIVRNGRTVEELLRIYPDALVLYMQTAISGRDLKKKLEQLGRKDSGLGKRVKRSRQDLDQYVLYMDLYNAVLINVFDESLLEQLRKALRRPVRRESENRQRSLA